ncbi:hypothetical protein EMIT0P253_70070 [Pseudomonas sp. IT-P253]
MPNSLLDRFFDAKWARVILSRFYVKLLALPLRWREPNVAFIDTCTLHAGYLARRFQC